MNRQVTFPRWPTWNFHFTEKDVVRIVSVKFYSATGAPQAEYPLDQVRLAIGRSGVSGVVFKDKINLPPTAERADAVTVEYEV